MSVACTMTVYCCTFCRGGVRGTEVSLELVARVLLLGLAQRAEDSPLRVWG